MPNAIQDPSRLGEGKQITNNRHIPRCVIAAVLHCGRQCIAIGDDDERVSPVIPIEVASLLR